MADSEPPTNSETTEAAPGRTEPQVIHSVAVTVGDVVAALEANRSADRGAVLRITPPFAGRMRARLHVDGGEGSYDGEIRPIHLDPASLVADVPPYPTADDTAGAGEADPEAHRRRHTERVAEWRETVRERIRDDVTVVHETGETLDLRVLQLG